MRPTFATTVPFGGKDLRLQLDSLVDRIRRRQLVGSWFIALETALLLRHCVSASRWSSAEQLLSNLRAIGQLLCDALPTELVIGNIVRRVMHLVREEQHALRHPSANVNLDARKAYTASLAPGMTSSVLQLFDPHTASLIAQERTPIATPDESPLGSDAEDDTAQEAHQLKPAVIQAIQELLDELETVYSSISERAVDHVHSK